MSTKEHTLTVNGRTLAITVEPVAPRVAWTVRRSRFSCCCCSSTTKRCSFSS